MRFHPGAERRLGETMATRSTAAATSPEAARADVAPESRYAAARTSTDPRERLLAQVLETLAACIPMSVGIAFGVDGDGRIASPQALWAPRGPGHGAGALVADLRALEDGGPLRRTLVTARLERHGYGEPLLAWFRRPDRVVAGVALLRESRLAPFDAEAERLLAGLQPLLEDALCMCEAPPSRTPREPDPLVAGGLTARETQVARLVSEGVSNACIAATLGMSEATVKTHLTRIYVKVGVRSRTELAVLIGRRS
jgi:DNA-binding CsgD family transcriptional regulator